MPVARIRSLPVGKHASACQASEPVLYDSTRTVLCSPCLSFPMAPRLTRRCANPQTQCLRAPRRSRLFLSSGVIEGMEDPASTRRYRPLQFRVTASLDQQRIAKFCRSLSAKDRRKACARTRRMRWLSHGATPQPDPLAWRGERGLDNQACPSQSTWRKRRQE